MYVLFWCPPVFVIKFLVIQHPLMFFLFISIRAIGLGLKIRVSTAFVLSGLLLLLHLTCRQGAKRLAKLNCSYWDAILYILCGFVEFDVLNVTCLAHPIAVLLQR